MPGVFKGGNLGLRFGPVFFPEQDIVCRAGIEVRVEIDEVNALFSKVLAENVQVVPEVELVLPFTLDIHSVISMCG